MPEGTRTVYVVDEDGGTWVFVNRYDAERWFVNEGWTGAVHLTITKAEAPAHLTGDALENWCIGNVPPTTCPEQ